MKFRKKKGGRVQGDRKEYCTMDGHHYVSISGRFREIDTLRAFPTY
jgi:hypothetical protein